MKFVLQTIAVLWLALMPAASMAQIVVDITDGTFEPMPTAIPDFQGDTTDAATVGADIAEVIRNDLSGTGLFRMINEQAFIERNLDIAVLPSFADWKTIRAEALVVGKTIVEADGRMSTQFRLFDVFTGRQLYSQQYTVQSRESWRRVAHIIADDILRTPHPGWRLL